MRAVCILLLLCLTASSLLLVLVSGCHPNREQPMAREGDAPIATGSPGTPGVANERSEVEFRALAAGPQQALPAVDHHAPPLPLDLPVPAGTPREVAREAAEAPTPPAPGPGILPDPPPLPQSPAPASSFISLPDNNKSRPPDTHGAVGPYHLMTTLNTEVLIQARNGKYLYRASLGTFWKGYYKSRPFDPRVHYDPQGKRWITVACADSRSANSAILIAVSQTNNPLGKWNRYRLDVDPQNGVWFDFPSVGFNKDWIVVQGNMYTVATNSVFKRSQIWVFDKADLYKGGTGKHTLFTYSSIGGTQSPSITHGSSSYVFLVSAWSSSKGCLRVFHVKGAVGSEKLYSTGYACGAKTWYPVVSGRADFAPQKGTSRKLQVNDSRMRRVVYRNGRLWAAHTVILGHPSRSSVQWWRINPWGTGDAVSRIDDPTGKVFRAFPSLAVNKFNDVLIGYSRFSATTYASAAYRFRHGSEAAMSLQPEKVFKAGEAPYYKPGKGRNRWGDYSATVVDPVNDVNMWTIQEYAAKRVGVDRWGTWWAGVTVRPLGAGAACTSRTQCRSDSCVGGVCCDVTCNGACQTCSAKAGATKNGVCTPLPSSTVCRKVSGPCDAAENCTGKTGACPTNKFTAKGKVCRKATSLCDAAEACTGASATCPKDGLAPKGTVCRKPAGDCDPAEVCSGAASACPADKRAAKGMVCRLAGSACDLSESCDGVGVACPADKLAAKGTLCRKTAGACDVAEACDGSSPGCPANKLLSKATTCRSAKGPCDAPEACTGATAACPPDRLIPTAHVCRKATGGCDLAETCTGHAVSCPADRLKRSGKTCRAAAGTCDQEEQCNGVSASCPADALMTAGVVCRQVAGRCDAKEVCSGTSSSCPTDKLHPVATVCRPAAGSCDLAESCDGQSSLCPADLLQAAGEVCRAAKGECDLAEKCPGGAATCPADVTGPDGVPCASGAGTCLKGKCKGAEDAGADGDLTASDGSGDGDLTAADSGGDLSPDTGEPGPEPGPEGCSCRATSSASGGQPLVWLLLFLWVVIRRRVRS